MGKLKAILPADGIQQGRHHYDFISSATVSLQVVFLQFNVASYHRCMLYTVDIRGAFLNDEFTITDTPINVKINKDVVPYWTRQDPNALHYVSANEELILLLDWFLFGLKQFQLYISRTLIYAEYSQSIYDECLFHKRKKLGFSYTSTHSDDLLHCVSCKILAQKFKDTLIKTYHDILYHEHALSYIWECQ